MSRSLIVAVRKTWRVNPGMVYALVKIHDGTLKLVQSCPAGTQYWNVDDAEALLTGERTMQIYSEIRCEALQWCMEDGRARLAARSKAQAAGMVA